MTATDSLYDVRMDDIMYVSVQKNGTVQTKNQGVNQSMQGLGSFPIANSAPL